MKSSGTGSDVNVVKKTFLNFNTKKNDHINSMTYQKKPEVLVKKSIKNRMHYTFTLNGRPYLWKKYKNKGSCNAREGKETR